MRICAAFPVLPGKEKALSDFVRTIEGEKLKETEAANQRLRIRKVGWLLQATPNGNLLIYYSEDDNNDAEGMKRTMASYAICKDPFDIWFKEKWKEITGFDFNQPLPGPLPEELRFREYHY